jgi:cytoskeletal protein RodZ
MQNIGERLEEARKRKGISIREAAEATKVRGDYLHKFESSQFDINLPEIYVRGFLRAYSNYLGLSGEKIVNDYNALGHGKPEPEGLNREIYGRMDLSVATAKDAAREPDQGSGPKEEESENPATFKPSPGALPYIDKALLIKGAALVAAVLAVILIVWLGVRTWSDSSQKRGAARGHRRGGEESHSASNHRSRTRQRANQSRRRIVRRRAVPRVDHPRRQSLFPPHDLVAAHRRPHAKRGNRKRRHAIPHRTHRPQPRSHRVSSFGLYA